MTDQGSEQSRACQPSSIPSLPVQNAFVAQLVGQQQQQGPVRLSGDNLENLSVEFETHGLVESLDGLSPIEACGADVANGAPPFGQAMKREGEIVEALPPRPVASTKRRVAKEYSGRIQAAEVSARQRKSDQGSFRASKGKHIDTATVRRSVSSPAPMDTSFAEANVDSFGGLTRPDTASKGLNTGFDSAPIFPGASPDTSHGAQQQQQEQRQQGGTKQELRKRMSSLSELGIKMKNTMIRRVSSSSLSITGGTPKVDKRSAVDRCAAKPRHWRKDEDEMLRRSVAVHGEKQWKDIAADVLGRNHTQCLQRWSKVLVPGLKKGQWSAEEDRMLLTLALEQLQECTAHGRPQKVNWGNAKNGIPGRTAKQCRERWVNNLDPEIRRDDWAVEEDAFLMQLYEQMPQKWAAIAKQLRGRTENMVKIRWKVVRREQDAALSGKRISGAHGAREHRPGSLSGAQDASTGGSSTFSVSSSPTGSICDGAGASAGDGDGADASAGAGAGADSSAGRVGATAGVAGITFALPSVHQQQQHQQHQQRSDGAYVTTAHEPYAPLTHSLTDIPALFAPEFVPMNSAPMNASTNIHPRTQFDGSTPWPIQESNTFIQAMEVQAMESNVYQAHQELRPSQAQTAESTTEANRQHQHLFEYQQPIQHQGQKPHMHQQRRHRQHQHHHQQQQHLQQHQHQRHGNHFLQPSQLQPEDPEPLNSHASLMPYSCSGDSSAYGVASGNSATGAMENGVVRQDEQLPNSYGLASTLLGRAGAGTDTYTGVESESTTGVFVAAEVALRGSGSGRVRPSLAHGFDAGLDFGSKSGSSSLRSIGSVESIWSSNGVAMVMDSLGAAAIKVTFERAPSPLLTFAPTPSPVTGAHIDGAAVPALLHR